MVLARFVRTNGSFLAVIGENCFLYCSRIRTVLARRRGGLQDRREFNWPLFEFIRQKYLFFVDFPWRGISRFDFVYARRILFPTPAHRFVSPWHSLRPLRPFKGVLGFESTVIPLGLGPTYYSQWLRWGYIRTWHCQEIPEAAILWSQWENGRRTYSIGTKHLYGIHSP